MPFFGVPIRNGLPIGLGSVAGFGVQQFDPSLLFEGGTVPGAWYDPSDLTTMFTTSAGTTPVAMPGQGSAVSVGLMLDKSQGLVLGSELVTNGDFDTDSDWTKGAGWTISGGSANKTSGTTSNLVSVANVVTPGKLYEVTFEISNYVAGSVTVFSGLGGTGNTRSASANGVYSAWLYGGTSDQKIYIQGNSTFAGSIDNISVRELPGNHAIAFNNTTARPELRARVNLLTYSEDFSQGVWGTGAGGGASISKGTTTGVRPDGTTGTVHTLTFSAVSAGQFAIAFQAAAQAFLNVQLTSSLYVRVASGTATIYLNLEDSGTAPSGTNFVAGSAQTVTTSWQRISLTGTRATAPNAVSVVIGFDTRAAAGQTNAAPVTIEVWGADLRPANIGANVPAYQRIADANTYDTSGFPLYLLFEGAVGQRGMYTPANLNLSGTDKVAVFAGVRRLAEASYPMVVESGATGWDNNNGAFGVSGGDPSGEWRFGVRGAGGAGGTVYYDPVTYTPPITSVLSMQADLSGATKATTIIPRVNGVLEQEGGAGTTSGGGNFGNYPLYIGSRANSSLWLNGQLYSLIIAGSAVSAGNISATEQWVAGKTGIQI